MTASTRRRWGPETFAGTLGPDLGSKMGETRRGTTDAPDEPLDALLARHGPIDARGQLGPGSLDDLLTRGSSSVDATVVVGDLRMSAFVLKEAVQPSVFARFIIG
ncbi:MAG TPA: hypothetical protein VIZ68_00840, partial [Thermoplasmata archaeon]